MGISEIARAQIKSIYMGVVTNETADCGLCDVVKSLIMAVLFVFAPRKDRGNS